MKPPRQQHNVALPADLGAFGTFAATIEYEGRQELSDGNCNSGGKKSRAERRPDMASVRQSLVERSNGSGTRAEADRGQCLGHSTGGSNSSLAFPRGRMVFDMLRSTRRAAAILVHGVLHAFSFDPAAF